MIQVAHGNRRTTRQCPMQVSHIMSVKTVVTAVNNVASAHAPTHLHQALDVLPHATAAEQVLTAAMGV